MYQLFAIASAFSTALGTFLTRSLIQKLPAFQIVGPLFLLNGFFAIPLVIARRDWISLSLSQMGLIVLLGSLTALGALFVFVIVKRGTASLSIVGASLSPAMVLVLSPMLLGVHIKPIQFLLVGILAMAALFPIRKLVVGVRSSATFLFMLTQGINAGVIAILATKLSRAGVGLSEFLFLQQFIAGIIFTSLNWPKDVELKAYPLLAKRSLFMCFGWFFSFVAMHKGSTLVVQSVLSAIPLLIVMMETLAYKKRPSSAVIFSSVTIILCITALSLT